MSRAVTALAIGGLLAFVAVAQQQFDAAWHAAMPSYYAALLASARSDADGTTRHLLLFSARLKELAARPDAPAWATDTVSGQSTIAAVAARVETARQRTLARDLPGAHASLERIRYVVRDARTRHGARGFDEAITDYHEAMERLTSRVGLHNEIMLAADDYKAIQEQAAHASRAWSDIESRAGAQNSLPGWGAAAARTTTLLATLQKAASAQDAELAQTTAEALKANYYDLLAALARASS